MSAGRPNSQSLATVSLLVREYDEAIASFTQALRFKLVQDLPLGLEKRWVVVFLDLYGNKWDLIEPKRSDLVARHNQPARQKM